MSQFVEAVFKIERAYERILHDLHRQLADHLRNLQEEKGKMGDVAPNAIKSLRLTIVEPPTFPALQEDRTANLFHEWLNSKSPTTDVTLVNEVRPMLDQVSADLDTHHRSCALRKGGDACTC